MLRGFAGRSSGYCYLNGSPVWGPISFACKKRMLPPPRSFLPGWRITTLGPRSTRNGAVKVHWDSAHSCGVAILYRPAFQVLNVRRDDSGRLVVVEFSGNNFDFQVMCLYMLPTLRMKGVNFLNPLSQYRA